MKRKNKPIRRQDTVQPLPLPADASEIAFAHGVSRRVVVVDAAESPLFEQIIYIVRDDAACGGITAADLVQQARDAVGRVPPTPASRPQQKTCTGLLIWLCANVQVGGDSILNWCTGFLDPFARLLGLDGVILMAFLLGFPANEIVIPIIIMAYLSTGSLLEFDSLDEEIEARKGRGCHLFIFSGGNPLAREQETIALCNKHTDCVFAAFTPPRFITGELCADLLRVRNLFPAIQVDEDGADAARATALLRRYKLPFGVACRCTAENAERVATELYYDRVIATGAKFCWFFTCPAYGPEQPASLEQLEAIHRRVQEFRRSKPLLTLDFWDGPSPSAAAPQGGTA